MRGTLWASSRAENTRSRTHIPQPRTHSVEFVRSHVPDAGMKQGGVGRYSCRECPCVVVHSCTLVRPDAINYDWSRCSRPTLTLQSLWSAYTLFFLGDIVQMYLANFSGIAVAIVYLVR